MFRVKICGITNRRDALDAVAAGADALGLNFYCRSRRYVLPGDAAQIVRDLPGGVCKVGVFVNAAVDSIRSIAEQVGLDAIQLHGDEPVSHVPQLRPYPIIRAFRCGANAAAEIEAYVAACQRLDSPLAGVLIDAFQSGQYGGTGRTADWSVARGIAVRLQDVNTILAGGLNCGNVSDAIAAVGPCAVDVAGGVELRPGQKDKNEMERFVSAARFALGPVP